MGEIWLARDLTLERSVVVKVLRAELTQDSTRVTRFRQEARAASALNHPNVCTIHALGETAEGEQFIAMEHVDGDTLRQRLATSQMAIRSALDIAIQIASALATAHAAGVVHRDLKPENVMMRRDGLVKVVDFGLAKLVADPPQRGDATLTGFNTQAGVILGTVAYMSPEQARGQEVDARTDIWTLGVILFEMITGRHPFAAASSSEVVAAILDREPPPLARFEPDAGMELQRIVGRALRKDREQRYQTMKDLLLDLQALRDARTHGTSSDGWVSDAGTSGSDAGVEQTPPRSTATTFGVSLARPVHAALVAGILLLLAMGGWWVLSKRPATDVTPSVVVLPFSMIGGGDGYLSDGITEAVTTALGKVDGLHVIASNTAFGYRSAANRDVARALGVGLVIRGVVQRADDKIRIDVSLVDAANDRTLWSDRYPGDVTDLLAMQDDISKKVATTMSERFGLRPHAKSPAVGTRNSEAYDAYLRGLWHLNGRSSVSMNVTARVEERRLAVDELERAVSRDPQFAMARAALASAYTQRFFYDATDRGFEREAMKHIDKALTIDPDLAEAYLARAQLTWTAVNEFPHEAAIDDLRRAVAINPNLAQAYIELGKVYYHIGLTDKALEAHDRAERLDPSQASRTNRGFRALVDAGRTKDVQAALEHQRDLGAWARAEALVVMSRLDETRQLLSESNYIVKVDPEYDPAAVALLALVYARQHRRADAEKAMALVLPDAENRSALSHIHHAQFYLGATLAWLGRHEEAVQWLTTAADQGYPSYPRFSTDPNLAPLRGHPGFAALVARLRANWERWLKEL